MDINGFREDLMNETDDEINASCICGWAQEAESYLNDSLDVIVNDDQKMYEGLLKLKAFDETIGSCTQKSLRMYYEYATGFIFPTLRAYQRSIGIKRNT